jgi:hypothetical protein
MNGRGVPPVETHRRSPAALIQLAGGLTFAAIFVYFSLRAKFTIPYIDDWSWIASLSDHRWTKGLWTPHNEHVIVIPRLLLWLDLWVWGWPGYATWAAGLASHAGIAAVLIATTRGRSRSERQWLAGAVLVLMFLTYELQGLVFPSAVNFPLVSLFGCVAIAVFCRAAEAPAHQGRLVALSAAAAVAAMLCVTNGFLVPVVLVGLSVVLAMPRRVAWVMAGLTVWPLFLRYGLAGVPATVLSAEPAAIVRFALAMLAGPLASLSGAAAISVGGLYVLGAIIAAVSLARRRPAPASAAVLTGCVWFVLLSAGMASLGRAQFDLSVGAESRYTELVAMGWASLLLLTVRPGFLERPRSRFLAGSVAVLTLALLPLQLFVGRIWAIKADHLDVASLVLTVGVPMPDWMWRIHPGGSRYIADALPELQARDVSFLRFADRGQSLPDARDCGGSLVATSLPSGTSGFELLGVLHADGASVRVVDRDRKVVGAAKPAPAVLQGQATADAMVWAELDLLRGRLEMKGRWLGFAQAGAGPPYSARLLDREGRVVCAAPVECCRAVPQGPARQELIIRGGLVEGWLDGADCSMIYGWAWDSMRPRTTIAVQIRVSNGVTTTVSASASRPDLAAHTQGSIDHGFLLRKPEISLPPGTWQIEARTAETGAPLSGSPRTVTCR